MQFIDLKTQYQNIRSEVDSAIKEVLESSSYIMGPQNGELEQALAAYVGVKHCLGVSSGTDALLIALMALGIQPHDEVITVPFTWISTAEVISLLRARPVFVDIEPETYNMDLEQLEAAITPRTRAIMPVSLFGQMPDYGSINAIAEKYGIPVIEDGAQSFGATQNGRRSCGVTTIGATSFFPAKPLGCYGDGGALFTDDDEIAAIMRAIRTHGGERRHHHPYVGINGRLDTLQAAILLIKLKIFPAEVEARQRIGERYNQSLQSVCSTPATAAGNTHVFAQYTIRCHHRAQLQAMLKERGIPTGIYYPKGVHEQPPFAALGYRRGNFPVTEQVADEVLSLPMHPYLSEEEQDAVVAAVMDGLLAEV